jgi:hypothetical protein
VTQQSSALSEALTSPTTLLATIGAIAQAAFATTGAANGGLTRAAAIHRWLVVGAFAAAVAAVILVALMMTFSWKPRARNSALVIVVVLFLFGLTVTAWGAVIVPGLPSQPQVSISVSGTGPYTLKGNVKATGVPRSKTLTVTVEGLKRISTQSTTGEVAKFSHEEILYEAKVGAEASGNASDTFSVFVPHYDALLVLAGTDSSHVCSSNGEISIERGGTSLARMTREGCAFLVLPPSQKEASPPQNG